MWLFTTIINIPGNTDPSPLENRDTSRVSDWGQQHLPAAALQTTGPALARGSDRIGQLDMTRPTLDSHQRDTDVGRHMPDYASFDNG